MGHESRLEGALRHVVEQESAPKMKRTLFRGAVYGASPTRLTALLLRDRDYLRLQRYPEKKLRALTLGAAFRQGQGHIKTLSSRQVWVRWRLPPPAYELCSKAQVV